MNELEFIDSIDCCFPYHDQAEWHRLILQGKSISDNAFFVVLHEICRKPASVNLSEQEQLVMLEAWARESEHPLSRQMIEAAKACITDELLPLAKIREWMDEIKPYRNQYAALSILHFACEDMEGEVEVCYEDVVQDWTKSGEE